MNQSLAAFVRADRPAILAAWKKRIGSLPASDGPSLVTHGARVLDWLATSLEEQVGHDVQARDLPPEESFSAPRAIAELALLTETIDQLQPASVDSVSRHSLHRVIEAAIAQSLARDSDESDKLRKRLRLATDVTLVGSWECDPVTGIAVADARSRELFGLVDGEPATVDALTSHLHAGDRERVRLGIANTLGAGEPYMDDCRTVRADESACRWIAIAADGHQGAHAPRPRVLGIVHDITDRKRTEEEHARVVEELSRAVHISEMFVGILSHDLRNPLNSILAGAQLLGVGDLPADKSARIVSLVVSSGERMGRMIEQLLDFTRARLGEGIPLDRAPVDLADLARAVVEEGKAATTGRAMQVTARGDAVGTWDPDRLSQIVSNLVGNAVQHGQPGPIDVVVDGTDPDSVSLSVANPGVIPSEVLPVIFNPFRGTVQKRGQSKGLGLGLYVARQIALAHGGELESRSTAAGLVVFELKLPRVPPRTPPRPDFVRDEELAAFERMAAPPSASAVTAQLFGATSLHERAPLEHSDIVKSYGTLLDTALHRKAYRGQGEGLADDLRALAERLGDLGAGPREVTEVHARALRLAVRGVSAAKTQALLSEGRLLALELMGNLASYYRRRSRGQDRASGGPTSQG